MTNLCDVCGKPATQSMLRDLFGKSNEMRFVCSDHGFRIRDPADVAEIERLRAALESTLPAVEEMVQQAAPRQKDHWHKILVEASTAAERDAPESEKQA